MSRLQVVDRFTGEFAFLSNFYDSPITLNGFHYRTVEHAFQAMKTKNSSERERIRRASTPGLAKRLGRQVTLRRGWDEMKIAVMRDLLRLKFSVGTELAEWLCNTGDAELIEGNYWGDTFWGVCEGEGENMLGKLLMEIRDELQQ